MAGVFDIELPDSEIDVRREDSEDDAIVVVCIFSEEFEMLKKFFIINIRYSRTLFLL